MAFTPIWGCGFEMGTVPTKSGVLGASACTIYSSLEHTGAYCLVIGIGTDPGIYSVAIDSASQVSIGVWILNSWSRAETRIYLNNPAISLRANFSENTWDLYVANTLVAAGAVTANLVAWHNVQINFSTSRIQTMIDGNIDIDYSGTFDAVTSVAFYAWGARIDDVVIGTGDWSGDIRFDALIPNGDTAVHSWKPTGISLQASPAAPTVGLSAGTGITGDYRYKVTLVDTDGETLGGTASALVQPSNQVVALSNIPIGLEGTTARKIYRTAAGGSTYKLVATISDNTTTTYNDSLADGSLGANEPANVHYTQIDEQPASDADYIYIATDGAQDIHTLTDWDATKKQPLFVTQWLRTWKDTADTQQLKFLLKSGISSTVRTSDAHNLNTSAAYESELHATDPDGNAWTNAELDALQSGVEAVVP